MQTTSYAIAIARPIPFFFVVNRNRNQKPILELNGNRIRNYNRVINLRYEWTLKQFHLFLFYVFGGQCEFMTNENGLQVFFYKETARLYFME